MKSTEATLQSRMMKYHSNSAPTFDIGEDDLTLPLEDAGKAAASWSSRRHQGGGSWWRRLLLPGVSLGVGLIAGMCLQLPAVRAVFELVGREFPATQDLPHDGSAPATDATAPYVVALGRLRPSGGTVAVALPNGAGDARIARLMVSEGQQVEAGEVIGELDNMTILLAAKTSAESGLAVQQAALEQVRATMLANLAESRANHLAAEAALTLANQAFERQNRLAASNSTTQVLVEQAQANVVKANAEFGRTAALVERFGGAETGSLADIALAARHLDLARSNLVRAEADLASARVVAPRAGTVLEVHTRVGEKPSDTGVLTIGDVTQMTAELEVYQTDVNEVELAQIVNVTARALPGPLLGKVTRIGQIIGRQSVMSTEPAANADARIVLVTVSLDATSSASARSFTNLEVVGRIRTKAE